MSAIVVIAASAGGFAPLRQILRAQPPGCTASFFVVMHIGAHQSVLAEILDRDSPLQASFPTDGATIEPGHVYVAPSDHHMTLQDDVIWLDKGPKVHHTRPAADPLFMSAALAYGKRVVGIVLSGGGEDGARGLKAIKDQGGVALVQNLAEAATPSMPLHALLKDHPDAALTTEALIERLGSLCGGP